jgi:hypothetical protein
MFKMFHHSTSSSPFSPPGFPANLSKNLKSEAQMAGVGVPEHQILLFI